MKKLLTILTLLFIIMMGIGTVQATDDFVTHIDDEYLASTTTTTPTNITLTNIKNYTYDTNIEIMLDDMMYGQAARTGNDTATFTIPTELEAGQHHLRFTYNNHNYRYTSDQIYILNISEDRNYAFAPNNTITNDLLTLQGYNLEEFNTEIYLDGTYYDTIVEDGQEIIIPSTQYIGMHELLIISQHHDSNYKITQQLTYYTDENYAVVDIGDWIIVNDNRLTNTDIILSEIEIAD